MAHPGNLSRALRSAGSAGSGTSFVRWAMSLLLVSLLALNSAPARAQATECTSFTNATLDGFVDPVPPSNINIDTNCTVQNFPAGNELDTNFAFNTDASGDERWLIIFDNVVHSGQMS
jgi:hypothetical protein